MLLFISPNLLTTAVFIASVFVEISIFISSHLTFACATARETADITDFCNFPKLVFALFEISLNLSAISSLWPIINNAAWPTGPAMEFVRFAITGLFSKSVAISPRACNAVPKSAVILGKNPPSPNHVKLSYHSASSGFIHSPISFPISNPTIPAAIHAAIDEPKRTALSAKLPWAITVPISDVSKAPKSKDHLFVMAFAILLAILVPNFVNFAVANPAIKAVSKGASSNNPFISLNAAFIASHNAFAIVPAIPVKSNSQRNSPIFWPINSKSVFLNIVATVVNTPLNHTLIVSAAFLKSKVWKNAFIPSAIESPKSFQSNSCPNEFNAYNAVFKAPAIVLPVDANNSGEIRPFKNSARPLPKFLAPW